VQTFIREDDSDASLTCGCFIK